MSTTINEQDGEVALLENSVSELIDVQKVFVRREAIAFLKSLKN